MLEALAWPSATLWGRPIVGKPAWLALVAGYPPPVPRECLAIAHHLGRHLLCLTVVGRRRLRGWLDAQRGKPIEIESVTARRRRIAQSLKYFGDDGLMPLIVDVLDAIPRPVADHVLDESMVITSGYSSAGWT